MNKINERRALDRLAIPQTTIFLIKSTWFDIFSIILSPAILRRFFKATILKDISKSGACIVSDQPFNWGDPIILIVLTPGENRILIKGRVKWITFQDDKSRFYIGIQFLAFGKGRMYNSFQCQKELRYFNTQNAILGIK